MLGSIDIIKANARDSSLIFFHVSEFAPNKHKQQTMKSIATIKAKAQRAVVLLSL
jgi:hypothetical protein